MKLLYGLVLLTLLMHAASCYRMRSSNGGGQMNDTTRSISTTDIAVPPGYKIEAVAEGLTFPSGATFDNEGKLYVIEAGYSYGEVWTEPRLIRIDGNNREIIARGSNNGPWTGVTFYNGNFYVAEGGARDGGKILKISPAGEITSMVQNLPSMGDHHTNGPAIHEGYIYFGQGTATNSAVVGTDNASFGWLARHPDFHDIPCNDIVLTGKNYESENAITPAPGDKTTTGAFSPFGTATTAGQVIKGQVPCNGAIMRIPLTGGTTEVVAWGLRNPFGLAFANDGKLFVTENGYDDRGSRPVWGSGDVLWEIKPGTWYGFPDFSGGTKITNEAEFKVPGKEEVQPLQQQYPNPPPAPTAVLGVHSSSNGIDFSTNASFGFQNEAFIAQFGDMSPNVGKVLYPVGFKVVRVDVNTGVMRDFAVNKGKRNGPATWLEKGGLERPVAVQFDPSGENLYIVDFGIMRVRQGVTQPIVKTGVIWKISKGQP